MLACTTWPRRRSPARRCASLLSGFRRKGRCVGAPGAAWAVVHHIVRALFPPCRKHALGEPESYAKGPKSVAESSTQQPFSGVSPSQGTACHVLIQRLRASAPKHKAQMFIALARPWPRGRDFIV